jgi:hypothetical protein
LRFCKKRSRTSSVVNDCQECGGSVIPRRYPGGTPRRFCSRRCGRLGQHRRYHARTSAKHRNDARQWGLSNPHRAAFLRQRATARRRGIEWHITFEEWLAWWGDDIVLRGRYAQGLCMCRTGDVGPYALSNIYKGTLAENTSFAQAGRSAKKEDAA